MNRIKLAIILAIVSQLHYSQNIIDEYGALTRSDTSKKDIYLCFTGHDYDEGFKYVLDVLKKQEIKASFFLTGDFIRNHEDLVKKVFVEGHYIGAHSNKHLLYCDWIKRDSLLVSVKVIKGDIQENIEALEDLQIYPNHFMPPYEWYNKKVIEIASELNQTTINFSLGTRSNADYTEPNETNYISSKDILKSIYEYENFNGLNGFHLLIHPGVSPLREDKFYFYLESLITEMKKKGYHFQKF